MAELQQEIELWHRQEEKKRRKTEKRSRKIKKARVRRNAARLMLSPEGTIIGNREHGRRLSDRKLPLPITESERISREEKFQQDIIKFVVGDRDQWEGLRVQWFNGRRGRSVRSRKVFVKGDFVAHYAYSWDGRGGKVGDRWETRWGELLTREEGERRNKEYATQEELGSYMFFFRNGCIDATFEPPVPFRSRVGRLINHSRGKANVVPEMHIVHGMPQIIFRAKQDIQVADFIDYNYNDISKCDENKIHTYNL